MNRLGSLVRQIRISLAATLFVALLLCGVYPVLVWALAQGLFPEEANGSLLHRRGETVGSSLIAQGFTGPEYFHPRPSAAGTGYDAANSSGTNLGPTSEKLVDTVRERVRAYRAENGLGPEFPVPADAVTASGSGLDPHISVANAMIQARRVARVRGLSEQTVRDLVEQQIEGRTLGILGEPRVNVLVLNLALGGTR